MSDSATRAAGGFLCAEVSSRSLGLLRVAIITGLLFQLMSLWVSHRMDDQLGTLLFSWLMFFSSFFVLFGYKTRIAAAICAGSFAVLYLYYGFYFDGVGIEKLTWHVVVFQPVLLLAFTPSGRSISIDRIQEVRAARREGRPPAPETTPAWTLELFVIQVATIYLWGAYQMTEASWLAGDQIELYFVSLYGDADSFARHPWLMVWSGRLAWWCLISCVMIVPGLLWRRTRKWFAAYAVLLQMLAVWLTNPSLFYGAHYNLMIVYCLLACLPPERVHVFIAGTIKGARAAEAAAREEVPEPTTQRWQAALILGLTLLYLNVGPLRGHALEHEPGPLSWTWEMRDPAPKNVCEARFYDMNAGGEIIARWELLDDDPEEPSYPSATIRSRSRVNRAGRQICDALKEANPERAPAVEGEARCSKGRAWGEVMIRDRNLCDRTTWPRKSQTPRQGQGQGARP